MIAPGTALEPFFGFVREFGASELLRAKLLPKISKYLYYFLGGTLGLAALVLIILIIYMNGKDFFLIFKIFRKTKIFL